MDAAQRKIAVIGSSNTDMVVRAERIPIPGETILGGKFMMNPGGKGANQAVAAARMGGDVTFIAKVGNDSFGKEAVSLWKKENIHTDHVLTDPNEPSGVALIMVDEKGENCINVAPGANAALYPADLVPFRADLESAKILLMQLETPVETVVCAAKWASEKGVFVILNPAPAATALPEELYPCLDLITPNETEAEILTGVKVTDEISACKAAEILCSRGVKAVIITMGASGSFCYRNGKGEQIPVRPVKRVDTTAAGDVFNGSLAVGLAEGMDLRDAVLLASEASTISVTRPGAQSSAPYRKECLPPH